MRYVGSFVFALVLIFPNTLVGQSVIGSSGLGMRVAPLDAVQRALGGVGVPTRTSTVLPGNPVAALDILAPTISFTVQPHWGEFQTESAQGDFFATRFPVFGHMCRACPGSGAVGQVVSSFAAVHVSIVL